MIPKPEQMVAFSSERPRPNPVLIRTSIVLPSISLNDELRLHAGKVCNEPAEPHLPAEFAPAQLASTQMLPEQLL